MRHSNFYTGDMMKKQCCFIAGLLLFVLFPAGAHVKNKDPDDLTVFIREIRQAINSQFSDSDIQDHKGKVCIVSVRLADDGKLLSVKPDSSTKHNDTALCDRATKVIENTVFPSKIPDEIIRKNNTFMIDFRP